jgi:uncharacterized protein (DUF1697 family)
MVTCVALLRGINVGGRNSLPMAELKALFESLGAQEVRTYIQSGNVVFHASRKICQDMQLHLAEKIRQAKGYAIHVLMMEAGQFREIAAGNPFTADAEAGTTQHVGFLAAHPTSPDRGKLNALKISSEQFVLSDNAFYLHAPQGFGKSKLAAGAERAIGVPMTVRNWKTVCALRDMLEPMQDQDVL